MTEFSGWALAAVGLPIVILYGYFADHFYTIWRDGRMPMGLSTCGGCDHWLTWEMTPVLGYLATRGRCRRCGFKVPRIYPVVEAAGLVLGVLVVAVGLRFASLLAMGGFFIAAVVLTYGVGTGLALLFRRSASSSAN
jgi:prepilin signal peptidase PulO-like enzyme (type II secretory pathway)